MLQTSQAKSEKNREEQRQITKEGQPNRACLHWGGTDGCPVDRTSRPAGRQAGSQVEAPTATHLRRRPPGVRGERGDAGSEASAAAGERGEAGAAVAEASMATRGVGSEVEGRSSEERGVPASAAAQWRPGGAREGVGGQGAR